MTIDGARIPNRRIDVVIAGAGPGGLGTAIDARLRGLDVLVREARDETWSSRSRVVALDGAALRRLDRYGVRERLFDGIDALAPGPGPATTTIGHLERTLLARATELGADVQFGAPIDDLVRGAYGIDIATPSGTLRATTFVDARGRSGSASSAALLGGRDLDLPPRRALAVGDVVTPRDGDRGIREGAAFSYAVRDRATISTPVAVDADAATARAALESATSMRPGSALDAASAQVIHPSQHLSTWVAARGIVRIGDAAGTAHPITGAGVSNALRDAGNAAAFAQRTLDGKDGLLTHLRYSLPVQARHGITTAIGAAASTSTPTKLITLGSMGAIAGVGAVLDRRDG